ncbi:hypothetical protein XENOCAPTIV_027628 [Xenoophorus captivus]|uniref:Uncharacterized protein n=1 Tax=Xenoophorus captivus TaxID=1517983 RepID=A0ABV0QPA8_9TELE
MEVNKRIVGCSKRGWSGKTPTETKEKGRDPLITLISFSFMTKIKLTANVHNALPCVLPAETSALMCRHHTFHAASSTITPLWIITSLHHKEHNKTSIDTPHPYSLGLTDSHTYLH